MSKMSELLKTIVKDATSENQSIANWLENGRWTRQPKAFLKNWLGSDVESERKGRSNIEMACDLATELREMKHNNLVKIMVANYYLETGEMPVDFTAPLLGVLNFDTTVNNVSAVLKGNWQKTEKYLKPHRLNCRKTTTK